MAANKLHRSQGGDSDRMLIRLSALLFMCGETAVAQREDKMCLDSGFLRASTSYLKVITRISSAYTGRREEKLLNVTEKRAKDVKNMKSLNYFNHIFLKTKQFLNNHNT